jgi:di/tricarboxylate transporter
MAKMMTTVGILSSFVNNTPIVALFTPYVFNWGKRNMISPSKLLIPLSFATIIGGMITLIGTSTTLVLNGFMVETTGQAISSMQLLLIGSLVFVPSIIFLTVIGPKLLPERKDQIAEFEGNIKDYLTETLVGKKSKLIGQSVGDAGLRNLRGVYLVEIIRLEEKIAPVSPNMIIKENDNLIFAGDTEKVMDLVNSGLGLSFPKQVQKVSKGNVEIIEGVLNNGSSLIGKKVKDTDFRNRYNAAIVAIHRNGERLSGKIGDMVLKSGDLLMLFAGADFLDRVDLYRDLYVISKIKTFGNLSRNKIAALITITVVSIGLLFVGYFSLRTALVIIV